jgi:hypothetical protein
MAGLNWGSCFRRVLALMEADFSRGVRISYNRNSLSCNAL